jgi:WhiB family redox-sensing transcriptional regulator
VGAVSSEEYPLSGCLDDRSWVDLAACRTKTELFFGPPGEQPSSRRRREDKAKIVCTGCQAQLACRDAGRRNHEHGIWGGENDEERAVAGFPPRRLVRRSVAAARRLNDSHDQAS